MRTNLPVTNVEHVLKEGELIVSKTDLQGRITHINKTFTDISGFTEADVVGQPHNIVRHPDMPKEAFEDLWRSLKAGKPWTGYVKNRCKNGDYYWVEADATPFWENGSLAGYMSVRKRPERTVVEQVEKAYRLFRDGKADGLAIREGKVVKTGRWARLAQRLDNATIKARLYGLAGMLGLMLLAVGGNGVYDTHAMNARLETVYQDRVVALKDLKIIADDYAVAIIDAANKANAGVITAEEALKSVREANKRIHETWKTYKSSKPAEGETGLAAEAEALFVEADASVARLENKLGKLSGRVPGQLNDFDGPLYKTIDPIGGKIGELIELQIAGVASEYAASTSLFHGTLVAAAGGVLLALLLSVLAIGYIYRAIVLPTHRISGQMREIAQGNMSLTVSKDRNDEIGDLADAFRSMFTKLGSDLAEASNRADEMSRIKEALDNVSTGVTVSDERNTLIYMNHAGKRLFDQLAADRGGAAALLGNKLSDLMEDGELKTAFTARQSAVKTLEGKIAGHTLRIQPSPVRNARDEYIGRVTEWQDRTGEVAIEDEVAAMVDAVANGDFSSRIPMDGKTGFMRSVSEGINRFVEVTESGLDEVAKMLRALADGDLTYRMHGEFVGTFEQLKTDANATVDTLTGIIHSIRSASGAISTAASQISAGNADLSSRTESQAASIEETAASMEELTSTVKNNAHNAREASDLAVNATEVAIQGGAIVDQVVSTMGGIADSSKKIADIISVIDSIAFQTNILALNAAVEAARAGEQGRGFAVVATEVRNLAQRSSQAAREIKDLIQDSTGKVEDGHRLVAQAGETMGNVVASVKKVSGLMAEISTASSEQAAGIEQVNIALTQMDEATQQNAALVEEASAAALSMEEQAGNLVGAVDVFKMEDDAAPRGKPVQKTHSRSPKAARGSAAPKAASPVRLAHAANGSNDYWEEF